MIRRRRTSACAPPEHLEPRRLLSAGDPDPTFGNRGRVVRDADGGAVDVVVQNDDSVFVAGLARGATGLGPTGFAVDHLLANGAPDAAFGANGRAVVDLGSSESLGAMAVQADGKILLAGSPATGTIGNAVVVLRLLADGRLDTTFGTNGRATVPNLGAVDVNDMVVAADGKIIVAGSGGTSANAPDALLVRLLPTGAPDTTFSGDGVLFQHYFGGDYFTGVAVDAAGRVVALAVSNPSSSSGFLTVARYTPAGVPDTAFNRGGTWSRDGAFTGGGMAIDSDGRIVGSFVDYVNNAPLISVLLLTPDGVADATFDGDGLARIGGYTPAPTELRAVDVAVQYDGKVLVTSTATTYGAAGPDQVAVTRLNTNGSPEASFGAGGTALVPPPGPATDERAHAISLLVDGRIVLAGGVGDRQFGDFSVVRLDPGDVAAPVRLSNGVLGINGSTANDTISLTIVGAGLEARLNGITRVYPFGAVAEVRINGGAGNDALTIGPGVNVRTFFAGGDGTDAATVNGSAGADTLTFIAANPEGFNELRGSPLNLKEAETLSILASAGDDRVDVSGYVYQDFRIPKLAVTLDGGDGNDTLTGGLGVDTFLGGLGNDTIYARDGVAETVNGGSGTDAAATDTTDTRTSIETPMSASVEGAGFNDADGDGTRDADEIDLITVYAYVDLNSNSALDSYEPSTFIAGRTLPPPSNYLIQDLAAGTYTIRTSPFAGSYQPTSPASGARTVTLTAGQKATGLNFGLRETSPSGTISGTLFEDVDNDGVLDTSEPRISGRRVYLDRDNDGVFDSGEVSVLSAADGTYSFTALPGRDYNVRQVLPTGWRQTLPSTAALSLRLYPGNTFTSQNFGSTNRGGIRGTVFDDRDGDGALGPSESGISRVVVYLDIDNNGAPSASDVFATTDFSGRYSFGGLAGGTYVVRQELQPPNGARWVQTAPANDAGRTAIVTAGGEAVGADFGTSLVATVQGNVFNDRNGNKVQEIFLEERGVGGVTVYLDADNDAVFDPGEQGEVTVDGQYFFRDVVPGKYTVRLTLQPGWSVTTTGGAAVPWQVYGGSFGGGPTFGVRGAPGVTGRHVFYNNSAFDLRNPRYDGMDDFAIATDKVALRPGQTATFANYTSYSRGINGVMIDLRSETQARTLADFKLEVAVPGSPVAWVMAPAPTLYWAANTLEGSDRAYLIWPDGAIRNTWLKVTVLATPTTRLGAPDVCYFGNLVGDTGDGTGTTASVNARDTLRTRAAVGFRKVAPISSAFDFNRDGYVDVRDLALARARRATVLQLITV